MGYYGELGPHFQVKSELFHEKLVTMEEIFFIWTSLSR